MFEYPVLVGSIVQNDHVVDLVVVDEAPVLGLLLDVGKVRVALEFVEALLDTCVIL